MSEPISKTDQLAEWLRTSTSAVAFTGAGISTESGIPDFRSPGGVWATNQPVYFDDFLASADARHEYWRQKCQAHDDFADAQPNQGHLVLARWEKLGRLQAIITQNIDGLHTCAGNQNVLELHGTAREIMCLDCNSRFNVDPMVRKFRETQQVPPCPNCAGRLKHATISFGQQLPEDVIDGAMQLSRQADLFIVIGSSLVVTPAADLPAMAKQSGGRLVIINRDPTPLDAVADLILREGIGQTLADVDDRLPD